MGRGVHPSSARTGWGTPPGTANANVGHDVTSFFTLNFRLSRNTTTLTESDGMISGAMVHSDWLFSQLLRLRFIIHVFILKPQKLGTQPNIEPYHKHPWSTIQPT